MHDESYLLKRKIARITVLGAFWVCAMAVPVFALGSDRVPAGTTVSGVDIGGLAPDEAVQVLNAALTSRDSAPITVKALGKTIKLDPAELGFGIDAQATVDSVRAHRMNPFDIIGSRFGGDSATVFLTTDPSKLADQVDMLASRFDQDPVEPEITYTGTTPVSTTPVVGTALDRQATVDLLARTYLQDGDRTLDLPVTQKPPSVSAEQAKEFATTTAAAALSAPVELRAGKLTVPATPADLAQTLSYEVRDGQLKATVDGTKLHQLLAPALHAVDTPAVDASWKIVNDAPVVTPSQDGSGVTDDAVLGSLVESAVSKSGSERAVDVPLGPTAPKLTTEAATNLGITEKMGSYTQKFPYAAYRKQNIGQAAKKVDGTLLTPGAVFSMNDTVGERTKANGYTQGPIVGEGGKLVMDMGGGVSTATTATYLAAFYAGLESVERGAHTIWISRYTPGLEATVAWGQLDMKFRNNTSNGVFITTKSSDTMVKVTIWGKRQYDSVKAVSGPRENIRAFTSETDTNSDCVPQEGVPGFDILVTRVLSKAGQDDIKEPITTHYIPAAKVQCAPASSTSASHSSSAKPTPTPSSSSH